MSALELRFFGDFEVVRDGERVALPPSKRTRALLAYLALNRRSFRREHLCELLWEIPDDPRGSLRWSLSKLRRLVDDDERCRLVADRLCIELDTSDVVIDVFALQGLADEALARGPLEPLEMAATRYCGEPLAGLDLPNFHDYSAWLSAQRDLATRAQLRLLRGLLRRLENDAERALPHAHAWVRIEPYDENARAHLIAVLMALGRHDHAAQQHELGLRMLKEAGVQTTGALLRAIRATPAPRRPVTPITSAEPAQPAPSTRQPTTADRGPSSPAADAAAKPAHPLFGRDAEVQRVAAALGRTMTSRRGAVLLVTGEPGIGKSRLLEAGLELARRTQGWVLSASAYESESIRPFALWTDALRSVDAGTAATVFGQADLGNRTRLFDSLRELVAARLESEPVVLCFDDVHWSDESSISALHYVVRSNPGRPLFCLLAARTDGLRDNAAVSRALRELRQTNLLEEIRLGPLPGDALREIIDAHAPGARGERLSESCGGNPLLAIELARAELAGDSGQTLGELVQERLAGFAADDGDVLRWAAVLAPRIDAGTLARVTGFDWNRIGEVLESAARRSMLQPAEAGFRFSHELIARSIYAGISPARRRTMHRRVAELLERDSVLDAERAADLAHHAAQSGDAALAARAMVSAGRLCLRFFANDEALSLARKGLSWTEQLPAASRVCLTLELREIMLTAAPLEDWRSAAQEYAALAEQALDHGALAHARRGYYMASYVHWMHGQVSGAREEILQSERVTRGAGDEEHIVGMAEAARCLAMLERDLTHADAMLMEAQALASRRHMSHYAIPAALGMLRFHENRLDEATELFKEARTLARSSGDRLSEFQAHEYLAMVEIERGRYDSARTHCAALIELGERVREGSERPFAYALDALCEYAATDDVAPLETALVQLRAADAKYRLAFTLTRAARIDLERRRPDAAIAHAKEALGCAETLGRPSEIMLAHVVLAEARRSTSDLAGYSAHVAALAHFEGMPVAAWARERATRLTLGTREARA
jgi:DNA-binding SARP family transcriptional activator/tetratricopeptide (TPR) repeat protein